MQRHEHPILNKRILSAATLFLVVFAFLFLGGPSKAAAAKENWDTCPYSSPEPTQGKKVLVTGASGFIGSHVAKAAAELGLQVIAIDDMSGGFWENVPKHQNLVFFKGDCKDAAFLEKVFSKHGPFEYVYHLAAYAAEGLSHFIASYNYRNNLVAAVEVLNFAIKYKVKCFVFTSSIAVYGSVPDDMREDVQPTPEDPYGVSKFAMELHLKTALEMHGIEHVIFRPHNVYGPNQNIADKYRNVVGIFMNEIIHNKPLTIFGDGSQSRSFSYIDDVAPIIAKSPLYPHARNHIFNVGADDSYSLNELAEKVSKAMDVKPNVVHLDQRKEVVHSEVSNAKVRCFFKLPPPTSLQEGLDKTSAWVKAVGKHYLPVEFSDVEIIQNMPPSWVRNNLGQTAYVVHDSKDNPRAGEYEEKTFPNGAPAP